MDKKMRSPSEIQEQLPLEDRETFLKPVPKEKENFSEVLEHETAFQRIQRIMRENQED